MTIFPIVQRQSFQNRYGVQMRHLWAKPLFSVVLGTILWGMGTGISLRANAETPETAPANVTNLLNQIDGLFNLTQRRREFGTFKSVRLWLLLKQAQKIRLSKFETGSERILE